MPVLLLHLEIVIGQSGVVCESSSRDIVCDACIFQTCRSINRARRMAANTRRHRLKESSSALKRTCSGSIRSICSSCAMELTCDSHATPQLRHRNVSGESRCQSIAWRQHTHHVTHALLRTWPLSTAFLYSASSTSCQNSVDGVKLGKARLRLLSTCALRVHLSISWSSLAVSLCNACARSGESAQWSSSKDRRPWRKDLVDVLGCGVREVLNHAL